MTHDEFRSGLATYHTASVTNGIKAGHSLRVVNLSRQIEDNLTAAEGRAQMASEDPGMAAYHRRRAQQYIAAARNLIAMEGGREAYELAKERVSL